MHLMLLQMLVQNTGFYQVELDMFLANESNKSSLMAFFIGWFMADGTIKWNWSGNKDKKMIKYVCSENLSRDEYIILWFEKRLTVFGIDVKVYKDSKQQTILKILNRPATNNKIILEAIRILRKQNIPMNDRLLWLEKFLLVNDGHLPEGTAPPRSLSFLNM